MYLKCIIRSKNNKHNVFFPFQTLEISGHMKMLMGQFLKGEQTEPLLALFAICCPFGPLPLLDVPPRDYTFKSKHKMDLAPLSMDHRYCYHLLSICMTLLSLIFPVQSGYLLIKDGKQSYETWCNLYATVDKCHRCSKPSVDDDYDQRVSQKSLLNNIRDKLTSNLLFIYANVTKNYSFGH